MPLCLLQSRHGGTEALPYKTEPLAWSEKAYAIFRNSGKMLLDF
jgi:hypothetical protein